MREREMVGGLQLIAQRMTGRPKRHELEGERHWPGLGEHTNNS